MFILFGAIKNLFYSLIFSFFSPPNDNSIEAFDNDGNIFSCGLFGTSSFKDTTQHMFKTEHMKIRKSKSEFQAQILFQKLLYSNLKSCSLKSTETQN